VAQKLKKQIENEIKRGEIASSECSKKTKQKKRKFKKQINLTYIKYQDHVLFRNCDSSKIKPAAREVVGWVTYENSNVLVICFDLPAELLPHEKPVESGLLILKTDIIERRELESGKAFKQIRIAYCGQKKPYKTEK
jgi:hypothetical protein